MAVRKETTRQQFTEAAAPLLEHGEQVVAGTLGRTGPSPWLSSAFGLLGFAVFALFGLRFYYLLVTDRRVLWLKASMARRPGVRRPADLGGRRRDPKGSRLEPAGRDAAGRQAADAARAPGLARRHGGGGGGAGRDTGQAARGALTA